MEKLTISLIKNMKNSRAVVPKTNIHDAVKQKIDSSLNEYILGKNRDNLFLTQTPQAFNLKEIYHLHKVNREKYKDDDISLYMDLNKIKFIKGEKSNFKITDKADFENLKNIKIVLIGGAPIPLNLRKKIAAKFKNCIETYGMTETLTHVALRPVTYPSIPFKTLPDVVISKGKDECLILKVPY